MRIVLAEPHGKGKCRISCGEGCIFTVSLKEAQVYGLKENEELTESVYREISDKILFPRAKEQALAFLEVRSRTKAEVKKKLIRGGFPEEVCNRVLSFLEAYGLIDDRGYVTAYLRREGMKKSLCQLRFELAGKGIGKEEIEQALKADPVDERISAMGLLLKKTQGREPGTESEKRKLCAYLSRKGYSWEVVRAAMREAWTMDET